MHEDRLGEIKERMSRILDSERAVEYPLVTNDTASSPSDGSNNVPTIEQIRKAIGELRPHLSQSLNRLSDEKLLALVNWNIMVAWHRLKFQGQKGTQR